MLEGYPAHAAGIQRGDRLISVNKQPYHPVTSFNYADSAPDRFEADSSVHELVLAREETQITVQLRPVFENLFDSYRSATLNSKLEFNSGNKVVGYLRLWGLSRSSNDLLTYQKLFHELDHCDGIILDLRDSYGFLDLAHLDLVYPDSDEGLSIQGGRGWLQTVLEQQRRTTVDAYRRPLAVLINSNTMAGPELLAYQLAKLERVISIGESTPGLIGDFIPSLTGTGYRYAPASQTLIDGEIFEGNGLSPEQPSAFPLDRGGRGDPQFQAAVDLLLGII